MILKGDKKSNRLEAVPGIGKSPAKDLRDLGIRKVTDLKGREPETMYNELCHRRGARQDRCVRYVFRSAVYFAETDNPDSDLVKWWNWKDRHS
ncbi:MAG: helix-hairpin-helix domain-containing protein [Bacteroidales bacterium]